MTQRHRLPTLPYPMDALAPHISKDTLTCHYEKHHAAYVDKLNKAIEGTEFYDKSLEDIIITAQGAIFNNAAQAWNHAFYWQCMSPDCGDETPSQITRALEREFGSMHDFKQGFVDTATSLFGCGWTWLVVNTDGGLEIVNTQNADNPLCQGQTPLLTCDVWEHAYYLDYQNVRADYLEGFWRLVNWAFVNEQFLFTKQGGQSKVVNQ